MNQRIKSKTTLGEHSVKRGQNAPVITKWIKMVHLDLPSIMIGDAMDGASASSVCFFCNRFHPGRM